MWWCCFEREKYSVTHFFFESDAKVTVGTSGVPTTLVSVVVVRKGDTFLLRCMVTYSL